MALINNIALFELQQALSNATTLLICKICFKRMFIPVVLQKCGHTFCKKCILNALSTMVDKFCPYCKHPDPSYDINPAYYEPDVLVNSIIEIFQALSTNFGEEVKEKMLQDYPNLRYFKDVHSFMETDETTQFEVLQSSTLSSQYMPPESSIDFIKNEIDKENYEPAPKMYKVHNREDMCAGHVHTQGVNSDFLNAITHVVVKTEVKQELDDLTDFN